MVHGREPKVGEILTYEDLEKAWPRERKLREMEVSLFCEAWGRRVPGLPCPLKWEGGKLFRRSAASQGREWVEYTGDYPRRNWACVEQEVLNIPDYYGYWGMDAPLDAPLRVRAVRFVESEDGRQRAEPLQAKSEIA